MWIVEYRRNGMNTKEYREFATEGEATAFAAKISNQGFAIDDICKETEQKQGQ